MKNCVYSFLNKNNEVIYIGKAKCLSSRLKSHTHLPDRCYEEKKNIKYVRFKNEDDMELAESYFISKLKPKYNTIHKNKEINIEIHQLDKLTWEQLYKSKEEISNEIHIKIKKQEELISSKKAKFNIIDSDETRKELKEAERGLLDLRKTKLIHGLGEREFNKLDKFRKEYYINYDVSTDLDLFNKVWETKIKKHVTECKEQILEYGYYFYSALIFSVDYEFRIGYLGDIEKEGFITLLPDTYNGNCDKLKHYALKMLNEIEKKLCDLFGMFKEEVIINESESYYGWMTCSRISIPQAYLVKRKIE